MTLGQKIRDCRVSQGMRRRDLATAIGMSYEHIANIENGHTNGAPETLVLIAKALGVPVKNAMAGDWAVSDSADPQPEPKREANPTSHPQPTTPVPPPPPRRRNGAKDADQSAVA